MKYTLEVITVLAVIVFAALFILQNAQLHRTLSPEEEAWGGTDDKASQIIESSGYEPWFTPVWEPPSGEIESLLFSVQAAGGALVIGYFFGYYRGKATHPKSP
ncbi:MAG: energy-coupling factor ABC transporter substrate-binding protein [Methanomicrobiales archaeon]|nr:energy-coupling factor ABC transporter substrate-binding protein [Methanomicrobiales archaeon]